MTETDDVAFDALRRFDQPHDLDPAASTRIEAHMLSRFDDVATSRAPSGDADEIVELRSDLDTRPPRRRGSVWIGLAAAVVVAVLGAVVFLRSADRDVDVPATQPTTELREPVDDTEQIITQLRSYCTSFIRPLVDVSALWTPQPGTDLAFDSEERSDVLVATESAAQGLVDLRAPAATLFDGRDAQILDLATEARRASTLGPGSEEAVLAARDAVLEAIESTPVAANLSECDTS